MLLKEFVAVGLDPELGNLSSFIAVEPSLSKQPSTTTPLLFLLLMAAQQCPALKIQFLSIMDPPQLKKIEKYIFDCLGLSLLYL